VIGPLESYRFNVAQKTVIAARFARSATRRSKG
jgi:hypothetical protein